jgi:hypothetical protein
MAEGAMSGEPGTKVFAGIEIVGDPELPDNRIEIRSKDGELIRSLVLIPPPIDGDAYTYGEIPPMPDWEFGNLTAEFLELFAVKGGLLK